MSTPNSFKRWALPAVLLVVVNLPLFALAYYYAGDWESLQFIIGHSSGMFLFVLLVFPIPLLITYHEVQRAIAAVNAIRIEKEHLEKLNKWYFNFSRRNRIILFLIVVGISSVIALLDIWHTTLDFQNLLPEKGTQAVQAAKIILKHRKDHFSNDPGEKSKEEKEVKNRVYQAYKANPAPTLDLTRKDSLIECGRYMRAVLLDDNRNEIKNAPFQFIYFFSLAAIIGCVCYTFLLMVMLTKLKTIVSKSGVGPDLIHCMDLLIVAASTFLVWVVLRRYTEAENEELLFGEGFSNISSIPVAIALYGVGVVLVGKFYHPVKITDLPYPITMLVTHGGPFIYYLYDPSAIRRVLGSEFSVPNLLLIVMVYAALIPIMLFIWSEARRNNADGDAPQPAQPSPESPGPAQPGPEPRNPGTGAPGTGYGSL